MKFERDEVVLKFTCVRYIRVFTKFSGDPYYEPLAWVMIIMFLEDIMFLKLFVGEVFMCEQETQIKAIGFIQGQHLYHKKRKRMHVLFNLL